MEEKQEGKLSSRFDERRKKKSFLFIKFSLPSPKKFFNPFQFPKNGKKISFMGEFQVLPRLKNAVPHLGTMPPGRRLKKKCVVLLLPSSSCPMCTQHVIWDNFEFLAQSAKKCLKTKNILHAEIYAFSSFFLIEKKECVLDN